MTAIEALTDLLVRLANANSALLESADKHQAPSERIRLQGKAEGTRLAISYVNDAIRQERNR